MGGAQTGLGITPGPAAQHLAAGLVVTYCPFPHVPRHIVQPQAVGFLYFVRIKYPQLFIGCGETAFDHERDVFIGIPVGDFNIRKFILENAEHFVDKALPHRLDTVEI